MAVVSQEITAEAVEQAVQKVQTKVLSDFTVVHESQESSELLETKCFGAKGVTDDVNHQETLAKLEVWTDQPRFFLKRLVAGCFFNPWDYQQGGKDDIRYLDVYGRKAKWIEVTPQIFQLYERFILGEDHDGKMIHNNLLLIQAEQLYKNSL